MPSKFLLGKAPFQRSVDEKKISTTRMMVDVIIALTPIILFAWIKNGLYPYIKEVNGCTIWKMLEPLVFVFVGGLASFIFELVYFCLFKKVRGFKNLLKTTWLDYAIIPGLILALILPYGTPIWVLLVGCLVANIIFKMLFGGFGHNIFNPALIAYAFLVAGYAALLTPGTAISIGDALSSTATVTPLTNYQGNLGATYEALVAPYGSLWNFFIGTIPGALGETSALLCIVGFIYLLIRKVINWRVPVIYVGTVFILSWIIGIVNGQTGLWYPTFNILSGGLMFGAVFMATEPVTTPKSQVGKVIFAFALGALTVLFRHIGSYPEGVATAILFGCLFTPVIDRFAAVQHASPINKKVKTKYIFASLLILAIASYAVVKAIPNGPKGSDEVKITFNDQTLSQDLASLDFYGNFMVGNSNAKVTFTYKNKVITYKESDVTLTDSQKEEVLTLVKGKLPSTFIDSISTMENDIIIKINQKGFGGNIIVDVTINNKVITKYEIISQNESYSEEYNTGYDNKNGDPITDYPSQLVGDIDINSLSAISGATITSTALKSVYSYAKTYIQAMASMPLMVFSSELTQDSAFADIKTNYTSYQSENKDYVLEFDAICLINGEVKTVTFNYINKELTISNNINGLNDDQKAEIIQKAKKLLPNTYISNAKFDSDCVVLNVIQKGYSGNISIDITVKNKTIDKFTIVSNTESFNDEYNSGYNSLNGNPINDYPNELIGNNVDTNNLNAISGATITSNALKDAYNYGLLFVNYLSKGVDD